MDVMIRTASTTQWERVGAWISVPVSVMRTVASAVSAYHWRLLHVCWFLSLSESNSPMPTKMCQSYLFTLFRTDFMNRFWYQASADWLEGNDIDSLFRVLVSPQSIMIDSTGYSCGTILPSPPWLHIVYVLSACWLLFIVLRSVFLWHHARYRLHDHP